MADGNGARRNGALAEVLAVVTTEGDAAWWRVMLTKSRVRLAPEGVEWTMATLVPWARLRGWAHPTPADALAALVEASLVPEAWLDPERAPRWWCERCGGTGRVTLRSIDGSGDLGSYVVTPDARGDLRCDALDVSGAPPCSAPPSHPALVAVVSLGADTLARAEELVADRWRARVVWRVMGAAALNDHFSRKRDSRPPGAEADAALVFALEDREEMGGDAWPTECPYAASTVRRAWPALRALAALGLHLLAVDAGRVTLGVVAL